MDRPKKYFLEKLEIFSNIKIDVKFHCGSNGSTLSLWNPLWRLCQNLLLREFSRFAGCISFWSEFPGISVIFGDFRPNSQGWPDQNHRKSRKWETLSPEFFDMFFVHTFRPGITQDIGVSWLYAYARDLISALRACEGHHIPKWPVEGWEAVTTLCRN